MKNYYKLTLVFLLTHMAGVQNLFADTTRTPLENSKVIIFDAKCMEENENMGYLEVELQVENDAASFAVSGTFHSYKKASSREASNEWYLIPIDKCLETERELTFEAGRTLLLDGQLFEKAYDAYKDVWGQCREHPHAGGGWYPCKKGRKIVTAYHREVLLNLGDLHILYKNK